MDRHRDDHTFFLITGPSASGKSTVARLLAERFARGVHLEGDLFRRSIVAGRHEMTPGPSDEALRQLRLRYQLAVAAADAFFGAGFTVVLEDVIAGPLLPEVADAVRSQPLHVIVLVPSLETLAARDAARDTTGYVDWSPAQLYDAFVAGTPRVGRWLDSSERTPEQTVDEILASTTSASREMDVHTAVPRLSDGVVVLDAFTERDVTAHLAGEDDEHARRFGWHPQRSTEAGVRGAFDRWSDDWRSGGATRAFATRDAETGELLGGCQIRLREKEIAELSYWTSPQHRTRGAATRAVRLVCAFVFRELRIGRVEAYVEPDNVASRRVVEAAGFTEEGVARERELTEHGERRDMVVYSLLPADLGRHGGR